jgi:uncharacterized protein
VNTVSELIDNRTHRISVLKEIIQHLHAGAAPELVKKQLRKIVGETDATEIMAMEQQLMAEGMPVEEVRDVRSAFASHARCARSSGSAAFG